MPPELDGVEVLRQNCQPSDAYVTMLTARADETDRIIGLGLGADDYAMKPFSPRGLVARIKTTLRRVSGSSNSKTELVSLIASYPWLPCVHGRPNPVHTQQLRKTKPHLEQI